MNRFKMMCIPCLQMFAERLKNSEWSSRLAYLNVISKIHRILVKSLAMIRLGDLSIWTSCDILMSLMHGHTDMNLAKAAGQGAALHISPVLDGDGADDSFEAAPTQFTWRC